MTIRQDNLEKPEKLHLEFRILKPKAHHKIALYFRPLFQLQVEILVTDLFRKSSLSRIWFSRLRLRSNRKSTDISLEKEELVCCVLQMKRVGLNLKRSSCSSRKNNIGDFIYGFGVMGDVIGNLVAFIFFYKLYFICKYICIFKNSQINYKLILFQMELFSNSNLYKIFL
jgi:hypothetical protein